jgi:hypothetical protein
MASDSLQLVLVYALMQPLSIDIGVGVDGKIRGMRGDGFVLEQTDVCVDA